MEITRLGIMGGTFNPIHLGHLMIAEEARQTFHLDKVLFVPSYITPNKNVNGATAEQRLAMTRLATADNPHFTVSDMEMRRKGKEVGADEQLSKPEIGHLIGIVDHLLERSRRKREAGQA